MIQDRYRRPNHAVGQRSLSLPPPPRRQSTDTRPMVEWIIPASEEHVPQTAEEAKEGHAPAANAAARISQPILDPSPPCPPSSCKEKLTGNFQGCFVRLLKNSSKGCFGN